MASCKQHQQHEDHLDMIFVTDVWIDIHKRKYNVAITITRVNVVHGIFVEL